MLKYSQINEYVNIRKNTNRRKVVAEDSTLKEIIQDSINKYGANWDMNFIDVSAVTDFHEIFAKYPDFMGDVSGWDMRNAVNTAGMFRGCEKFNCDLSRWDMKNVVNASQMFYGCRKFNSDLSMWEMDLCENMERMFTNCEEFNSDLSGWNVENCKNFRNMFYMCFKFNSNLSGWEINEKSDCEGMFYKCRSLDFDMASSPTWNKYIDGLGSIRHIVGHLITGAAFKKSHIPKAVLLANKTAKY